MRKLGPVQNVLHATIHLGAQVETGNNSMESTKTAGMWGKIWNERDVQVMVVISVALQLFLLFAGNVRRKRRVNWLRFLVWLAYLSAYVVATSAIGLFSQYEDKYKLRSHQSSEHLRMLTMPFLWAPFLLLHLGGPDTISAFSIEDNNLWTRQLISLAFQVSLALYVFWKSFQLLDSKLLTVAVHLFVAGIIKYAERICALKIGSRDSLDYRTKKKDPTRTDMGPTSGKTVESRALNSALRCRGLLVGRTLVQLGAVAAIEIQNAIKDNDPTEVKLQFVLTELGMIYDMLYTKAMVLQSGIGVMSRCIALESTVVAFVLFWVNQHLYAQRTTNAAITYTLFVAAIFVEVYSILMVIASPWTRARAKHGTSLRWLSGTLAYCFPSQGLPSPSMGQFNLTDYCLSKKSTPKLISEAFGLEKHWRNFRHVKHVKDKEIVNYIVGLFNTDPNLGAGERHQHLKLGRGLKFLLNLPFEHTLFRLHIYTEIHLRKLDDGGSNDDMKKLVAECRKLSNYLMYLMAVCPSMLPVGIAANDLECLLAEWIIRNQHGNSEADILNKFASEEFHDNNSIVSPFNETDSVTSLKDIKEVWARLLIYAAGKCRMELHARQLSHGVELLTVVGSLMMHHCLGDVGRKFDLLPPPGVSTRPMVLVHENASMDPMQSEDPLYAFEFLEHSNDQQTLVRAWDRHYTVQPGMSTEN